MHVLRLWCSASVTSVLREAIALQHGHMLKVIARTRAAGKPAIPAPITTACLPISLDVIAASRRVCIFLGSHFVGRLSDDFRARANRLERETHGHACRQWLDVDRRVVLWTD